MSNFDVNNVDKDDLPFALSQAVICFGNYGIEERKNFRPRSAE